MVRGLCATVLLLLSAGCLGKTTAVAAPPRAEAATGAEKETWPTSARSVGPAELVVEIEGAAVRVGGQGVESDKWSIQKALMSESSPRTVLKVRTVGAADDAVVTCVVGEAARAPASKVELSLGDLQLTLLSRLSGVHEPDAVPVLVWGAKSTLTARRDGETVAELEVGDARSESKARALLEQLCEGKRCTSQLTLQSDARLVPSLLAWQRVFGNRPQTLSIYPSLVEPGEPDASIPTAGQEKPGHRRPPNEVQAIVRRHYGKFRECYAAGLGRNARLTGIVSVKFVIARDGKVTDAQNFDSNVPDPEVIACVLGAFKTLEFTPSSIGSSTIVYPIALTPG